MNRRDFFKTGFLGTAALALPGIGNAAEVNFAGGVYYTKEAPGRWAKKVGGHLPIFKLDDASSKLTITTDHAMTEYKHYIVKHTLLDSDMNVIGETMFDPMKDEAVSHYDMQGKTGTFYALSMCNKHDVWLNSIVI